MNKGIVFNIQKFSIHDGPGIRTTIFLKGCPLKCEWCANPESQQYDIQILCDHNQCIHCLNCVKNCPQQAIKYVDNIIHIDHQKCNGCLTCINTCPHNALSQEGEYKEIKDIVELCLQDIDFYEESKGGITISGGEGMGQPLFLKELVYELKKYHLHLAIETTGYIKKEIFQELAFLFDLLLFDVKHYDTHKHYQGTHVHNKLIIDNLKWANDNHIDILPRIPIIPGFNDSIDDALKFSQLFIDLNIQKVQLLPFHQFGEKKYDMLNLEYKYKNKKALHPEDLVAYQQIFIDKGIDCFL